MRNSIIALSLVALALLFAAPMTLQAQQQQAAPPQQAESIDVSEQQLQSFAEAQSAIMDIQNDFTQRMQNAENPEAANQLRQQANEEMVAAVESAGLEVDTFNSIAMAIQNDPELQQKLQEMR